MTFLAAGGSALTALASGGPLLILFAAVALFGGLSVPLYSLSIAHTNDHLQPDQMVAASATLVMLNGIGASFGPLSAAWMMNALGPNGLFWWLAILHSLLGFFALYRMTRREAVALEDQGHYPQLPPRASPIAAAIVAEEAAEAVAETKTRTTQEP